MRSPDERVLEVRRPSRLWHIVVGIAAAALVATAFAAVRHQRVADRPIGEGQLFVEETTSAKTTLAPRLEAGDPETELRHLRNDLQIESVSLVGPDGAVVASTSPSLRGASLDSPILAFGLSSGRFVAAAAATQREITVDGVVEWAAGDVLYQVLTPFDDAALLLHYDISELLARRARATGISAATLQLAGAALGFLGLAVAGLVGRARVLRRNREMALEAALLREHSVDLEQSNVELAGARRRAEEALELAEETNRVRGEFVLMINHELRTPLTAVVTGADLLKSEPDLDPGDRAAVLDAIVADGRRLEQIIAQMLTVARIENRGLNFDLVPTRVTSVCVDAVDRHPRLEGLIVDEPDTAFVMTDPTTLGELVGSLADNAVTHGAGTVTLSSAGELPFEPMVEVGTRPSPAVHFLVADDGPGISADFLPRIFEKFEKDSFSSGTGLGLYLARIIVEALHGSLSVTTSEAGTTIAVSIPVAVVPKRSEVAS